MAVSEGKHSTVVWKWGKMLSYSQGGDRMMQAIHRPKWALMCAWPPFLRTGRKACAMSSKLFIRWLPLGLCSELVLFHPGGNGLLTGRRLTLPCLRSIQGWSGNRNWEWVAGLSRKEHRGFEKFPWVFLCWFRVNWLPVNWSRLTWLYSLVWAVSEHLVWDTNFCGNPFLETTVYELYSIKKEGIFEDHREDGLVPW